MPFVAKTAPLELTAGQTVQIEERVMFGGRNATTGDRIFIWMSERQGGAGLSAVGHIVRTNAAGQRSALEVRIENSRARRFGVTEIAPYRDVEDGSAIAGISRKLYRQAHNKIAELTEREAALLDEQFS